LQRGRRPDHVLAYRPIANRRTPGGTLRAARMRPATTRRWRR
jgi:hypothetical protein